MTDAQLSRVAAELAMDAGYRASAYPPRVPGPAAWSQDYGPQRRRPAVEPARSHDGLGWGGDGAGRDRGQDRVDDHRSFPGQALWQRVMAALCPGTRVFCVCLAIATFIVVV